MPTNALSERSSLGNSQRATTPLAQRTPKHRPYTPSMPAHDSMTSARNMSLNALNGDPTTPRAAPFSATVGPGSSRPTIPEGQVDIEVGDTVDVPGGMTGTVKFLGNVKGKKGTFAGIELSREYAPRGKNDGDVEGTRYFTTSTPGSGIFLPAQRAFRRIPPTSSADNFPTTPGTPAVSTLNLNRKVRESSLSPQTPQMPNFSRSARPGQRPDFSQSVGPGARAASPQLKGPKSRPSLPRPESPLRKQPSLPAPAASRGSTPGAGFSQSLRGGRPPGITPGPKNSFSTSRTPGSTRSPSRSNSRAQDRGGDEDSTPTNFSRTLTNGANRPKPNSAGRPSVTASDDNAETTRLRRDLEQRDRQLQDQATSLAEMEASLADLQSLVASSTKQQSPVTSRTSQNNEEVMTSDAAQLRALIREKNERIGTLTAEFDAHRADFRSTIDTLEMASTETERVYEKRVDELLRENVDLAERNADVENVAQQLKQLEEVVQELEDGLEDARRGEAEARTEVEFLQGEVQRGHSELRREREKAAKALKGAAGAVTDGSPSTPTSANNVTPRDLSQRDDEIRGLKAIIHSLSSGPDASSPSPIPRNSASNINGNGNRGSNSHANNKNSAAEKEQLLTMQSTMDMLNREKSELRGLIERKNFREEELERELVALRKSAADDHNNNNRSSSSRALPNGNTTSGGGRNHSDSVASAKTAIRPGTSGSGSRQAPALLPTSAQSQSRPGTGYGGSINSPMSATFEDASEIAVGEDTPTQHRSPYNPPPVSAAATSAPSTNGPSNHAHTGSGASAKSTIAATTTSDDSAHNSSGKIEGFMAQLTGEGPAPGKSSKRVDMDKWCALCERDGHESVDCPFEEEY